MIPEIKIRNLSKWFKINFGGKIIALRNISFDFFSGKVYGIVGKNRAGKTTLLRSVAKIYLPNSGVIKVIGKVVSLIDLKSGLRSRLTLRENIYLLGGLLGMSRKEISLKISDILAFSELVEFENTKIFRFSEGMKDRIVLTLGLYSCWDILLLDEVFSVSDEGFRKKALNKLSDLKKNKIILWASHDLDLMEKYCDEFIWISEGKIVNFGNKNILRKYKKELQE